MSSIWSIKEKKSNKVVKLTISAANKYPAKDENTTLMDSPILVTALKSARNEVGVVNV